MGYNHITSLYMGYGWIWVIYGYPYQVIPRIHGSKECPALSSMNAPEQIAGDTGVLSPKKMLAQYGAIIKQQLGVSENRVLPWNFMVNHSPIWSPWKIAWLPFKVVQLVEIQLRWHPQRDQLSGMLYTTHMPYLETLGGSVCLALPCY